MQEIFDKVFDELKQIFAEEKLCIVVDGAVSFLDEDGKPDDSLSWLQPEALPSFVLLVLVAREGRNLGGLHFSFELNLDNWRLLLS